MKNFLFKAPTFILSTFLLICVGCKKTDTLPLEKERIRIMIPKYEEPISVPTNEIWDTSKVDVSEIDSTRKLIAFTFDDAPSKYLENILMVFTSYNEQYPNSKAYATVFCNGNRIHNAYLPHLKGALALGFELGNHTYSHLDLFSVNEETIHSEIQKTDAILHTLDGKDTHLFRAPFGNVNESVKNVVTVPIIDWTIATLDWTGKSEKEIYDAVWKNKFSGAIVLFHDGYPATISALKRLLPDLNEAGYQVVSVSQLAKVHQRKLQAKKRYIRIRKQQK